MSSRTKLGLITLFILASLVVISHFFSDSAQTFNFEFSKTLGIKAESSGLKEIVERNLKDEEGQFAIFIEEMETGEGYALNEREIFPAASLYKLILLAAVLKEVEGGSLTWQTPVSATKTHLTEVLGSVDFGYEESSEYIEYTVEQASKRVAEISDNFAAILLTEKLSQIRKGRDEEDKLLVQMTRELGMKDTTFDSDPINTTSSDIGRYFKLLYQGKVVSPSASDKIKELLRGAKINNRIPAQLPEGVKVIHKTGELSRIRHDAGIVSFNLSEGVERAYVIVLMSKDLKYEDDGIEVLANLSKEIYEYFKDK